MTTTCDQTRYDDRDALTVDARKTNDLDALTTDDLDKVTGGTGGYAYRSYGYSRYSGYGRGF